MHNWVSTIFCIIQSQTFSGNQNQNVRVFLEILNLHLPKGDPKCVLIHVATEKGYHRMPGKVIVVVRKQITKYYY